MGKMAVFDKTEALGHAICEDSRSAVWKESGIMMWDSRKEP